MVWADGLKEPVRIHWLKSSALAKVVHHQRPVRRTTPFWKIAMESTLDSDIRLQAILTIKATTSGMSLFSIAGLAFCGVVAGINLGISGANIPPDPREESGENQN